MVFRFLFFLKLLRQHQLQEGKVLSISTGYHPKAHLKTLQHSQKSRMFEMWKGVFAS